MTTHSYLACLTSLLFASGFQSTVCDAVNISDAQKPDILLAQNYSAAVNPACYLVSEKLDGVRAIWDGKVLRFRSGHIIHAPSWFTANFPDHSLDGELWIGRHQFDQVSAATRKLEPLDSEWRAITYQLYELPNGFGTFEQRAASLKNIVDHLSVPWLRALPHFSVDNDEELRLRLKDYVRIGAEGLMLHRRDAIWQTGRSDVLLKLKMYLDAEARVIGYEPGKGKYKDMLGALLLEMPTGVRFQLGTGFSDEQRRNPPALGSVVTYRYRALTPQGVPRFAHFLRVREEE